MLHDITYFLILGKPLILYLGILTLCSFLVTASVPLIRKRGIANVPFVWHMRLAGISFALGLFHGTLGLLAYF